jgi:hypothetical protein
MSVGKTLLVRQLIGLVKQVILESLQQFKVGSTACAGVLGASFAVSQTTSWWSQAQ